MSKITSRSVDRKSRPREYRCPGCGLTKRLRRGLYWHTCDGHEWSMEDVVMAAAIEASVASALAGMLLERKP